MRIKNIGIPRVPNVLIVLFALFPSTAAPQIWEKFLYPGLTYRMEVDPSIPRVIQAIRYSPRSDWIVARPELAKGKVYTQDIAQSRATISEAVKSNGAIGGVNADFFPFTGDPLGLMIRGGEIESAPNPKRSSFGWSKVKTVFGLATMITTYSVEGGSPKTIEGLNQECAGDRITLNTERAGFARAKGNGAMAVLQVTSGSFAPGQTVEAQVVGTHAQSNFAVAPGSAVLTGTGTRAIEIASLAPGKKVTIHLQLETADWAGIENAVGGGPTLLKNGVIVNDWFAQGFQESFAAKRHPRTAVGRTKLGDVWFVAIDGRQETGVGATLEETAIILQRLGCVDAINLDGGGSTTMNLFGMTMNRPSDGSERPVANGVLFYTNGALKDDPSPQPMGFRLHCPDVLSLSESKTLSAWFDTGGRVPNRDVLWACSGAAWIDQGGLLRPLKAGKATVTAWVNGITVSATVDIR